MKIDNNLLKLLKLNGKSDEAYKEMVQEDIKSKHYDLNEELAIHRKAIKKILDALDISYPEFEEYNQVCESAKVEAKGRLEK